MCVLSKNTNSVKLSGQCIKPRSKLILNGMSVVRMISLAQIANHMRRHPSDWPTMSRVACLGVSKEKQGELQLLKTWKSYISNIVQSLIVWFQRSMFFSTHSTKALLNSCCCFCPNQLSCCLHFPQWIQSVFTVSKETNIWTEIAPITIATWKSQFRN